ncbi:MAG: hypothetical protein ABI472_07830 [Ginsengibacter sp.]
MIISRKEINNVELFAGENDHIKFEIVPAAGGKIISVFNKKLQKEFLWSNTNLLLETHRSGADYDSNFLGGIDELIPNDIPENIDGIDYPDHGEIWTTALDYELLKDKIAVFGQLALSGLNYRKIISLDAGAPIIRLDYTIRNDSTFTRNFLWKLHAALSVEVGDRLITHAKKAKVVDPDYSRFTTLDEFAWPRIENTDASLVPDKNNTTDFFYLYDIDTAEMGLESNKGSHLFCYSYDNNIFPWQWYFASYGGFLNHYTTILEPCTSMPMSVNDAKRLSQCTVLEPGQEINTSVKIYAGENIT